MANPMSITATILNAQMDAVRQLCQRHRVRRLELFGSGTSDRFDAAVSDLDFIVEFEALSPADRADAYFGLLAALQDVFQRKIDLVESAAIDNPYFKQSVAKERTVLYAA
jgi:predicted nucleotidyltransferase